MSEEIIHLVEHLSQHKSIQELYEFTKELYEYVSLLVNTDYSTEESQSSEEEETLVKETIKIKKDDHGFYSLD
jgi:uncharacterized protein YaaR (DUF327 family)